MSDLDRMTGIKRLRVRGMPQVRLAAVLKATGLNILRATAFRNRLKREERRKTGSNRSPHSLIESAREQFYPAVDCLRKLIAVFKPEICHVDRIASQAA